MPRTSADTHSALLLNRITNVLALVFLIILFVLFVSTYAVVYSLHRNCVEPYHAQYKLFGYWIAYDIGSTQKGCPVPE